MEHEEHSLKYRYTPKEGSGCLRGVKSKIEKKLLRLEMTLHKKGNEP